MFSCSSLQVWQFTRSSQSLCLSLWLSQPWLQHLSLRTGRKDSFILCPYTHMNRAVLTHLCEPQRYKVWFYFCFLSLVRVFVAVHSLETVAIIAISARSTNRRRAARTWRTSLRLGCPAKWTYSLPTMTACSAHTSAFGLPCPSTPTRWFSRRPSIRALTMETGDVTQGCLGSKNQIWGSIMKPCFKRHLI